MTSFKNDSAVAPVVRITHREALVDSWSRVERVALDYRRRDGRIDAQSREVYHRGHGAAVLLYDRSRSTVLLVRQFRLAAWEVESPEGAYPASETDACRAGPDEPGFLLEVPAGMLDHGSGAETVIAEAREEAGVQIAEPAYLFSAYVSPGSATERLHYFEAEYDLQQRVGPGGGVASEGEDIEVVELSIDEAWRQVQDGRIRDAKTIMLLQHALLGPLRSSLRRPSGGGMTEVAGQAVESVRE